jgi:hypothetical protein
MGRRWRIEGPAPHVASRQDVTVDGILGVADTPVDHRANVVRCCGSSPCGRAGARPLGSLPGGMPNRPAGLTAPTSTRWGAVAPARAGTIDTALHTRGAGL